ncbi:SAM-dependent methyltransferase [uncultured Aquimarina sp.]|uniref:SAM-dependent methyltransferase n=1 Tax=uncultured Aquimarina sp. TaxID=575652 RepID=UPI002611E2F4|nr:SAM-dependent methyltransferase [uncultured Aquimarina sp.]
MNNLFVVGGGMNPMDDLTLKGIRVAKRSDLIFVITGNYSETEEVLRQNGVKGEIADLMPLYHDGGIDEDNYRRIAKTIIQSFEIHREVSIVVNGDPIVGVSWWKRLENDKAFRAEIHYIDGISSMVSVFTKKKLDPIEKGSIIVDVNRLLLFRYEIPNDLNLLILDICSTGTRKTHLSNPAKDNSWDVLCDYLTEIYSENHTCYLVTIKMGGNTQNLIKKHTISSLRNALTSIVFGASLLMPAQSSKTVSTEFLSKLLNINI